MNKLYVVAGLVLVGVLGYFAFTYKSCEQPEEIIVQLTALQCAQSLITPELRVEACQSLGREDNCEFQEEDREHINQLILKKITSCVEKNLESQGMCTDKVKGILNGL